MEDLTTEQMERLSKAFDQLLERGVLRDFMLAYAESEEIALKSIGLATEDIGPLKVLYSAALEHFKARKPGVAQPWGHFPWEPGPDQLTPHELSDAPDIR